MADYLFREDLIAAVATPAGRGAVGIIRLSGTFAAAALESFWRGTSLADIPPRQAVLGRWCHLSGELVDQILLLRFVAPHSYTGEDLFEIHCHGNPLIERSILQDLHSAGVRFAQPGEFTYRAFRNGKMDLVQAEAVAELIEARGDWARRNALAVLAENGGQWVQSLMDNLLEIWTKVEADLQFPAEGLDALDLSELLPVLEHLLNSVRELQSRALRYTRLQEGYRVVLVGPPNAGKSSLLNYLLGYQRALVTEIPGTTRDTLEEYLEIAGIPVRLIDTAGLGVARDVLDQHGMARSREALAQADLVLLVVDGTQWEEGAPDLEWNRCLPTVPRPEGVPVIHVANKLDLVERSSGWLSADNPVWLSALTGEGVEPLLARIQTELRNCFDGLDERLMLNQRQAALLADLEGCLLRCCDNITDNYPEDLVATDLSEAKSVLEDLSGQNITADLLDNIFSRFCIGK